MSKNFTAKNFTADIEELGDYVDLLNGIFRLTHMEKQVFVYLLTAELQGRKPFDHETKKEIAEDMGREEHYFLNGYIKGLKDKGALIPDEEKTGKYHFHPLLVPQGEGQLNITLNWKL